LQPDPPFERVEVLIGGIAGRQTQLILDAMPRFVHQQHGAVVLVARQRPKDHRPRDFGPRNAVIRHHNAIRQSADEDFTHLPKLPLLVGLIGHDLPRLAVGEHHWPVEASAPQLAAVLLGEYVSLSETLLSLRQLDRLILAPIRGIDQQT
jgi:hypothetical protein